MPLGNLGVEVGGAGINSEKKGARTAVSWSRWVWIGKQLVTEGRILLPWCKHIGFLSGVGFPRIQYVLSGNDYLEV